MKLHTKRYEEIKSTIAIFLEDYNVTSLPIDVFELAKKMQIKIVFSSVLIKKHPKKIDEYILFNYPNSFLFYNPITQSFIIYIDDIGTKKKRQRFSLAHEIMHILLGHKEQNEKNEAEANFGATYLLAPTSLALLNTDGKELLDPEVIKYVFNVSLPEAKIIAKYNLNRTSLSCLKERSYEKTINLLLKDSLYERLRIIR